MNLEDYKIVPAAPEHVGALALTMRAEDVAEVWAAGRRTPREALFEAVKVSRNPKAALYDGRVLCMFGIAIPTAVFSLVGIPWMLGSAEMPKHARALLRLSRAYIQRESQEFFLVNYVDARYSAAVRWLRWLGFTIYPAEPFGDDQMLFHRFEIKG